MSARCDTEIMGRSITVVWGEFFLCGFLIGFFCICSCFQLFYLSFSFPFFLGFLCFIMVFFREFSTHVNIFRIHVKHVINTTLTLFQIYVFMSIFLHIVHFLKIFLYMFNIFKNVTYIFLNCT